MSLTSRLHFCRAQNYDINYTHRRKQLCYITSCEANGKTGLELKSSVGNSMNVHINKNILELTDIVTSNSVRIDQIYAVTLQLAKKQGIPLTAEQLQFAENPDAQSTSPTTSRLTSQALSTQSSPLQILPNKRKRKKIMNAPPSCTLLLKHIHKQHLLRITKIFKQDLYQNHIDVF